MHGEQYSDLYTGLYDDGNPEGALIQLSTKQNDTGNEFNDIFVNGKEHTLESLKKYAILAKRALSTPSTLSINPRFLLPGHYPHPRISR